MALGRLQRPTRPLYIVLVWSRCPHNKLAYVQQAKLFSYPCHACFSTNSHVIFHFLYFVFCMYVYPSFSKYQIIIFHTVILFYTVSSSKDTYMYINCILCCYVCWKFMKTFLCKIKVSGKEVLEIYECS